MLRSSPFHTLFQAASSSSVSTPLQPSIKSYRERAELSNNALTKRIFNVMADKETNLCVAADITTTKELLDLAENLGPYICVLKTHIDILDDFNYEKTIIPLLELARKYNFILFEDRKFADIGKTVVKQYTGGIFKIADWSPLTNAHSVPGECIIEAIKPEALKRGNGILLLAEMSSKGNLAVGNYTEETIKWAKTHADVVTGFITRKTLTASETLINFTPGIKIGSKGDALGQTYITPEEAMAAGTDVGIIGDGIIGKETLEDKISAAQFYQKALWDAYLARITVKNANEIANTPAFT